MIKTAADIRSKLTFRNTTGEIVDHNNILYNELVADYKNRCLIFCTIPIFHPESECNFHHIRNKFTNNSWFMTHNEWDKL